MLLERLKASPAWLDKRGVSQAVSSVILVMTAMLVSLTAFFFAQLNLTMQSEQAEFENAKEAMVSLARIIETLEEGDAHQITLSMNSGGPELTRGLESIRLTVWDDERSVEWNLGRVNQIKIRGGTGVPGSFRVLEGDVSVSNKNDLSDKYVMIRPDNPGPMGVVYQEWSMRAWIVVDFGRVKVMQTGTTPCTDDGYVWYRVNTVDIVYYNVTFGEISSSGGTFIFHVRVRNVEKQAPVKFYSPTVNVRVERGPDDNPARYSEEWEVPGFAGASITMVYVTVVNVEVSLR